MTRADDLTGGCVDGAWPKCGASAAIFRDNEVLLIERGKGALKGRWSLPGGHINPGETARAAALREVQEETGIEAQVCGLVDIHEVVLHSATDALSAHYLLAVFYGRWTAGEPAPSADAAAARFVPLAELERYHLTDGASALIHRGSALLREQVDSPKAVSR
jgi:8-oxo-dGTP diphosphatase